MQTTAALIVASAIQQAAQRAAADLGHAEVDLEHLLLGLFDAGGPAGRILLEAGLTRDETRAAVTAVHADRLAGVGVGAGAPGPTPRPHSDDAPWQPITTRATRALAAGLTDADADERVILRSLLADRSGLIGEVLERLGADPAALLSAADEVRSDELAGEGPTHSQEGLVAAPIAQVWDLVSTPSRRMEWQHETYESMSDLPDGSIAMHPRGHSPGTSSRPAGARYTLISSDPGRRLEWEVTPLARPSGPRYREVVELDPVDEHRTTVRLRLRVVRPNLRMRLLPGVAGAAFTLKLRLQRDGVIDRLGRDA